MTQNKETDQIKVLIDIMRQIDDDISKSLSFKDLAEETEKDRLFAILMERFEALQPYKTVVSSSLNSISQDPLTLKKISKQFKYSMFLMLENADLLSHSTVYNDMKSIGLGVIYIDSLRVWVNDSSVDMDKTMAYLDKRLSQADSVLQTLKNFRL